ncbi:hypothetical protein [Sunxiuqinia rutila]
MNFQTLKSSNAQSDYLSIFLNLFQELSTCAMARAFRYQAKG